MRKEVEELWKLAEAPIEGAGLELVELQWNREPEGWVLRVFIDRPGADGSTTFEDCERVSRDLSAALDVVDAISHAYRLEVSSPGIDRPLRRLRDFQRFAGHEAKIRTTDPVEGRRNFSGILRGAASGAGSAVSAERPTGEGDEGDGFVEVECEGKSYQLPVATIARAHLVPDWDAEFRRERSDEGGEPATPGGGGGNRPTGARQ
jgi:ribosome maturation factor RimP